MQKLPLSEFLLKLATDAKAFDVYEDMDKKERKALLIYAGLTSAQQAAVLSGDMKRVLAALKKELKGVVDIVDDHIMQQAPFFG